MSEPWFDPNLHAWIPGTVFGVLAGLWGSLAGVLAPRGMGKPIVLGGYWLLLLTSLAMLAAGIVALVQGQPYGVWYGLLLPGVIGSILSSAFAVLYRRMLQLYRQAEERKISAAEL